MPINRVHPIPLMFMLAACPESGTPAGSSSGSETGGPPVTPTTGGGTLSETDDRPDTTSTTDATTTEPTTTEPTTGDSTTTGGGDGSVTRVVYYPSVDFMGFPRASALRHVEIVDNVPTPAATIIDPPGSVLVTLDQAFDRRWSPYYSLPPDAPKLWLVDMQTLAAHEVTLPPELERVVTVRTTREDKHLLVWGAPLDVSEAAEYTYYMCELGGAGECTLERVEAATGPTSYVEAIHDISAASGRIWYTARDNDDTEVTVLQGDVAAPEAADTLAVFPVGEGGLDFISLDEKTAYFSKGEGTLFGMDISADPPGPLVEIFPAKPGARRRWSEDEKDLLLHVDGPGLWGDLFHLTVDGTEGGPVVQIEAGGANHVYAKSFQWISGRRVLFMGDQDTPMANQLYMADVAAPAAPPVKLSGPLQAGGELNDFHMRGDPGHVTYYAQTSADAPLDLFRARIDPPGEVHKLNGPQAEGSFLLNGAFDASPDGSRIVYAGTEVEGRLDLFLVEFDGEVPGAPINLTSGLPADTEVQLLGYFSPDGEQVFFRGRVGEDTQGPLFMVPLTPEIGPPVRLSDEGEQVNNFAVLTSP